MDSHLGKRKKQPRRQVFTADEIDSRVGGGRLARNVHGAVVEANRIRREDGGSLGMFDGKANDPYSQQPTVAGLPYEAKDWYGSATHYTDSELPVNDFMGMGFHGSTEIVSASELERIDQAAGTNYQPMPPGAYQLTGGNILLVGRKEGQKAVITQQQFLGLQQKALGITQQHQQRRPGLMNRVLGLTQQRRP